MTASLPSGSRSPEPIRYTSLDTPIGPVWMAGSRAGILSISLRSRSERAFLSALREQAGPRPIEPRRGPGSLDSLDSLERQLRRYFRGEPDQFSVMVDLTWLTPFQRRVLAATICVPFGHVVPYGSIARAIGAPGASRAVGNALGRNPVPILVPCHRVVASNGTLGGFTGGTGLKRRLLAIEGITL